MIEGPPHTESERCGALFTQTPTAPGFQTAVLGGGSYSVPSEPRPLPADCTAANVPTWSVRRARKSLPRLARHCLQFSHISDFDEALLSAVSRFYGVDVDLDTAETDILEDEEERIRFFPWYLWDFQIPPEYALLSPEDYLARGNDDDAYFTVGSRFLEEGMLSDFERTVVHALCESVLTFVEIREVHPNDGEALVYDYFRQDTLRIFDPSLVGELKQGQILLVRLVRLQSESSDSPHALVECVYYVLPGETRSTIQRELARILDSSEAPLALMKQAGPELLDLAEHLMGHLLETPPPFNRDEEPLVLCRTRLQGATAEELRAILDALPAPFVKQDEVFSWYEESRLVAQIIFETPIKCRLEASSRERFERLVTFMQNLGLSLPALRVEMDLERTGLAWLHAGHADHWLADSEVQQAFSERLADLTSAWLHEPHPKLNQRAPIVAWKDPALKASVEGLIELMRPLLTDAHLLALRAHLQAN